MNQTLQHASNIHFITAKECVFFFATYSFNALKLNNDFKFCLKFFEHKSIVKRDAYTFTFSK